MKAQSIILSLFIVFASITVNAQDILRKDTIKVWGECGMCKKTIEKSAIHSGAHTAEWNTDTKVLTVSYHPKSTTSKKIQQAIAASGYDTQDFTAKNEAYDKLHECCKYDRKETSQVKEEKSCCEGNDKECCKDGKGGKKADCCAKDGQKTTEAKKKQ